MAETLEDGEFWLPPQFLTDDVLFSESTSFSPLKSAAVDVSASKPAEDHFPLEFPYGCSGGVSSDLISPLDSLIGSAEPSGEDLLACKMDGRNDVVFRCENTLGWTVSDSRRKLTSDMCSKFSSPPTTWDLIGEVARMRMDEENRILNIYNRAPHKKSSPVLLNSNPDFSFLLKQHSYQKLQAAQFRQQQLAAEAWGAQIRDTQQHQARGKNICGSKPVGECAGTGVFLPRQTFTFANAKSESRKKSACSTVLQPAKVAQALKLDDKAQNRRLNGTFLSGGESTARPRNYNVRRRNPRPQPEFNRTEARLPHDWTYSSLVGLWTMVR